jgi:hypothetical protein
MFGQYYLKLVVKVTDDGTNLDDLLDYEEWDRIDLQSDSYWCIVIIFMILMQEIFGIF